MSDGARILVVEDESDMARVLAFNLSRQGYDVTTAASVDAARRAMRAGRPDLVLLDLRLPDGSGLDLLAEIKDNEETAACSVVIVSAIGDEQTVVRGLNTNADDYVTKPFRVNELMARVGGVLRRRGGAAPGARAALSSGDIVLDPDRHEAHVGGSPVELTRSEFALLAHFIGAPERVFTRHQLCHDALGAGDAVQERTIDAHVRTIRRKLGDAGRRLVTVWGIGYKLTAPRDAS